MAIAIGTAILPGSFKVAHATQNSNKGRRRTRASRSSFVVRSSVEEEESTPSRLSFDLSNMPEFDINHNRRANYNARRRIVQSRGVPDIHPEIFGQATRIERLWKEWNSAYRDSFSRGLEYLAPEVVDPEDEFIIENDGLWIEKKYPDIKTKSTIITKKGELLN